VNIYTAQFNYSGPDRLDITVKSDIYPGNLFAPTWDMVKAYKAKQINDWQYTVQWFSLMVVRFHVISDSSRGTLNTILLEHPENLVLVCYCPSGAFCHRILAAQMLHCMGVGKYLGEKLA
jgi:hypothetical protein